MLRGCMKNEKNNFFIIIAAVFFAVFATNIYNTVKSYQYRGLCNQYREQLIATENANRELRKTIEECQSICGELGGSIDRNINSAREAVELIEQIRTQVYEIENRLGGFNQYKYYECCDNEFGISQ